MGEMILFVILTAGFVAGLFYIRLKEQRYLKKPTREALSKELREEIEKERAENIRKKEKFEQELKKLFPS